MKIDDFMKKVFEKKEKEPITDEIFRFIESDKELLHDYLKLLETNKLNVLNSQIAKQIKKKFNLKDLSLTIEKEPKSMLIQSFTSFNNNLTQ